MFSDNGLGLGEVNAGPLHPSVHESVSFQTMYFYSCFFRAAALRYSVHFATALLLHIRELLLETQVSTVRFDLDEELIWAGK